MAQVGISTVSGISNGQQRQHRQQHQQRQQRSAAVSTVSSVSSVSNGQQGSAAVSTVSTVSKGQQRQQRQQRQPETSERGESSPVWRKYRDSNSTRMPPPRRHRVGMQSDARPVSSSGTARGRRAAIVVAFAVSFFHRVFAANPAFMRVARGFRGLPSTPPCNMKKPL